MLRCAENRQTFRCGDSDGRLSHIKELIAWRTSVGGGGGVKPRSPKGRAAARGLDPASASNTLSCQRETLHSQQLRSIKKSIDSDHGIYRDPLHFELRFLGGNRETAGLEHEWIGRAFSPTFLIPGCQCLDLERYFCDAFDWKRGDHRSDLLL